MSIIETSTEQSPLAADDPDNLDDCLLCEEQLDLSLFETIIKIGSEHGDQVGFTEAFFASISSELSFVREKLGLTTIQTILLCDLFCLCESGSVDASALAKQIRCKPVEVFAHLEEFETLERKGLIEVHIESGSRYRSGLSFKIPFDAIRSIRGGECPENCWAKELTSTEFMERAGVLCEESGMDRDDYGRCIKNFDMLLRNNPHLEIVRAFRSYSLVRDNELMLLRFCTNYVLYGEDEISLRDLESCFESRSNFSKSRSELRRGIHPLQSKELIEFVNRAGFLQKDLFCLTEKAKDELLGEYVNLLCDKTVSGLIEAGSIVEKSLFYPEKTGRNVEELTDLLRDTNWNRVRKTLCEKGMRTGFAVLFSGGPGTGKSESAMQIARATGRGIMQVDISDTKSCWFGESEKKIKAIFNRYRAAVKSSDVPPILLFNEADAVIGKRQRIGETRNGPAQTENAIQNIILQEIENLDGILIATTNLTQNMDAAFERRFLYKIEFEPPTVETRKSIWRTMIPELLDDDVVVLAERFEFSGGQIENIARRRMVAEVLDGVPPALSELIEFCHDEQAGKGEPKRIGFGT